MKLTGIVEKVDELERVVLLIKLQHSLNINEKDPIEIYVAEDQIILKKYVNSGTREKCGEVIGNIK